MVYTSKGGLTWRVCFKSEEHWGGGGGGGIMCSGGEFLCMHVPVYMHMFVCMHSVDVQVGVCLFGYLMVCVCGCVSGCI